MMVARALEGFMGEIGKKNEYSVLQEQNEPQTFGNLHLMGMRECLQQIARAWLG